MTHTLENGTSGMTQSTTSTPRMTADHESVRVAFGVAFRRRDGGAVSAGILFCPGRAVCRLGIWKRGKLKWLSL